MTSAKPFFNCPCRLSICMFLQNISPIGLFITMLWLTKCFFEYFYSNNSMINDLTKTIFTSSMSISMVLQNFSPIRYFLHNKGPQNMPKVRRTKKKKKRQKKSRQNHRGCPNYMYHVYGSPISHHHIWPWAGNNLTGVAVQFAIQDRENAIQVSKYIAVFAMRNAIFHTKFSKMAIFCYAKFWK